MKEGKGKAPEGAVKVYTLYDAIEKIELRLVEGLMEENSSVPLGEVVTTGEEIRILQNFISLKERAERFRQGKPTAYYGDE